MSTQQHTVPQAAAGCAQSFQRGSSEGGCRCMSPDLGGLSSSGTGTTCAHDTLTLSHIRSCCRSCLTSPQCQAAVDICIASPLRCSHMSTATVPQQAISQAAGARQHLKRLLMPIGGVAVAVAVGRSIGKGIVVEGGAFSAARGTSLALALACTASPARSSPLLAAAGHTACTVSCQSMAAVCEMAC